MQLPGVADDARTEDPSTMLPSSGGEGGLLSRTSESCECTLPPNFVSSVHKIRGYGVRCVSKQEEGSR